MNKEFTLKLNAPQIEAILNLINLHPPAPLTAATELYNSIQMQVAEQTKPQESKPQESKPKK